MTPSSLPGRRGTEAAGRAELRAVDVRASGKPILTQVDLTLGPGDLVVLVGPNGAGKSTVLRTLVGRIRPAVGQALLDRREVRSYSGPERASRIAWLPQMAEVREPVRVLDLVVAARFRFRESHGSSEGAARAALERFDIPHLAERHWPGLSGGERQRIALATLWAQEAPLLLLDEPANHLDPTHQIETYRWIADLARAGRGVLCVTHDVDLIGWLADQGQTVRVVGIRDGRIRFDLPWNGDEIQGALGELFDVSFEPVDVNGQRRLLVAPAGEKGARRLPTEGFRTDAGRSSSERDEHGGAR